MYGYYRVQFFSLNTALLKTIDLGSEDILEQKTGNVNTRNVPGSYILEQLFEELLVAVGYRILSYF